MVRFSNLTTRDDVPSEPTSPVGTRLYGMQPLGLGTARRESLRGYLIRLSVEHCIRPRDLVSRVLGEIDPDIAQWNYARFHAVHALTVDGPGTYARTLVAALEAATGQRGLGAHALLPWGSLLAPNGQPLLARRPRWCPDCLAESIGRDGVPYWQLRWSVALAEHCPDHGCLLCDRCGNCGHPQPGVPRRPNLGRCDHCGFSLARKEMGSRAVGEDELQKERVINDLIAVQDRLSGDPRERLVSWINDAAEAVGDGGRAGLCRAAGFQPRALNKFVQGHDCLSMTSFVRLCLGTGCNIKAVFANDRGGGYAPPSSLMQGRRRQQHGAEQRLHAGLTLREAAEANYPPTLTLVAARAGVSRGYLQYWFPEQVRILTDKRRQVQKQRRADRLRRHLALLERTVGSMLSSGEFPGRKLIERAARCEGFSLMNPGMLDAYHRLLQQGAVDSGGSGTDLSDARGGLP